MGKVNAVFAHPIALLVPIQLPVLSVCHQCTRLMLDSVFLTIVLTVRPVTVQIMFANFVTVDTTFIKAAAWLSVLTATTQTTSLIIAPFVSATVSFVSLPTLANYASQVTSSQTVPSPV
jgi:hypothetical protein